MVLFQSGMCLGHLSHFGIIHIGSKDILKINPYNMNLVKIQKTYVKVDKVVSSPKGEDSTIC